MSTVINGALPHIETTSRDEEFRAPFPGVPTTSDGAGMVVWVETHVTQGACAYPITSSTTMGGGYQAEVANGKRLPAVFHIGARAITSHSLNVHAGHDDVYGVADCGWGALFARNAQEAGDLALIARRAAEETETPFLNVQDGFLTTHTIENVRLPEPELMKQFVGD